MALTLENANLTWQRVKISLESLGAKPQVVEAFKTLKTRLATVAGNPTLQFVAIADLTADVVVADAACKIYGVYLKKQNTGTDSFYKVFNDAASDSSAEDAVVAVGLLAGLDEVVLQYPKGLAMSAGAVHGAYTAMAGAAGTTASTTGDGPNGFILIGAA